MTTGIILLFPKEYVDTIQKMTNPKKEEESSSSLKPAPHLFSKLCFLTGLIFDSSKAVCL